MSFRNKPFINDGDEVAEYPNRTYTDYSILTNYVSPERLEKMRECEEYDICELDATKSKVIIHFVENE